MSEKSATSGAFTFRAQKKVKNNWNERIHIKVKWLTESNAFNAVIMLIIFINAIFISIETDNKPDKHTQILYQRLNQTIPERPMDSVFFYMDLTFLIIYTIEFILKIYAEPKAYWQSTYNIFDFIILAISYVQVITDELNPNQNEQVESKLGALKVFRAMRTLRTLRTVSFVKGLQVLVIALIDTIRKWVTNIIILLLLLMFLFAIMGYYLFEEEDPTHWASLDLAMLTLFSFVTVDGWTDIQMMIENHGFSKIYTSLFIITGHFIFYNVFIGVIIMNISEATEQYKREQQAEREAVLKYKKEFMMMRQHNDVKKMLEKQKRGNYSNFNEMVQEFQMSLRHDDSVMMTDLSTNLIWIETYRTMLNHMDDTLYRVQQLHFEMANHLASVLDESLRNRYGVTEGVQIPMISPRTPSVGAVSRSPSPTNSGRDVKLPGPSDTGGDGATEDSPAAGKSGKEQ